MSDPHEQGLCQRILQAIPADDVQLRSDVTVLFDRIRVLRTQHVVDDLALRSCKITEPDFKEHIERRQKAELAERAIQFIAGSWGECTEDGWRSHRLRLQMVLIAQGPLK